MEKEKKTSGSYVTGTIGAIIGGVIATLPWILCYVYANMMWSILAVFIAMGAFKGYELMKGKIDKKVPVLIVIVSVIAITVATLVIIPNLLLVKEYGKTSLEMFGKLYEFDEFRKAILGDYAFSLLFTFLGISGVIGNLKRSIAAGDEKIVLGKKKNSFEQVSVEKENDQTK